jgi:ComF family protein
VATVGGSTRIATAAGRPLWALGAGVLDAVLPQTCLVCGGWLAAGDGPTCEACAAELSALRQVAYCGRCGRTLAPGGLRSRGCARCRHESFWNVAGVARVGVYEEPLRGLILRLKYGGHERNAEVLGAWLAEAVRARGWAETLDGLVPVPMHWLRRWQRPCEHAELLAAAAARRLGLPVLHAVRRIAHRPSQTGMYSRAARFANVKGCFAARRWPRPRLAGRCVCVVDNLLTSGATAYEVAKVLRRAGARRIYVAVVGRTALAGDPQAGSHPLPLSEGRGEGLSV